VTRFAIASAQLAEAETQIAGKRDARAEAFAGRKRARRIIAEFAAQAKKFAQPAKKFAARFADTFSPETPILPAFPPKTPLEASSLAGNSLLNSLLSANSADRRRARRPSPGAPEQAGRVTADARVIDCAPRLTRVNYGVRFCADKRRDRPVGSTRPGARMGRFGFQRG
jgi:hypothetical protein